KCNLVAPEKDASLNKEGISQNYLPEQRRSKISITPLKPSNCSMENGFSDYISNAQISRKENADAISASEDEGMKDYYDGIVREIQESRRFGEEEDVDYTYCNLKEEIQCMKECEPEGDVEYSYEGIIKEIQNMPPYGFEEVDHTYDALVNDLQSTPHYAVESEERNDIHEDITSKPETLESSYNHNKNADASRSRIKIISNSEVGTYLMARKIIRKYKLKRLSKIGTTVWGYNGKSYAPLDDQKLGELIYSEIPESVKLEVSSCARLKKNVIEFIRDELAQAVKEGNRDFYFSREDYKGIMGKVVLQNGVLDIRSGLLEGFDAAKPYYYELSADYLEVHDGRLYTPAFDKLISDACGGDRESIQMIIQVLGMLLIPDPCKKFPVVGPASNSGKSVLFGGLLEEIFPRSRISHVATSELKDKFALGNAEDMLLISCMDVDMDTVSAATAGVIKRATGEEVISVQDKYKPRKDIEVRFKFVFGSNGAFCPQKDDAGWQNRILAVPFIYETPEKEMDMHLLDKLLEEKDAIVTKVLRAMASAITEEGELQVRESELSIKLKASWTTPNTCFDEFMSEMIEVTGEEADNYSMDELYEAYCQYYICSVRRNRERYNNVKVTRQEFASNMLKYGRGLIEKKRVNQSRKERFKNAQHRFCGLLLKNPDIFDNADRSESEI
ncbi:MAG: hypothetical protein K2P65_13700, partial [Lachnospiraceae bacterium]|nr:hypothetical protein [Lachnospiraceae bacterium]